MNNFFWLNQGFTRKSTPHIFLVDWSRSLNKDNTLSVIRRSFFIVVTGRMIHSLLKIRLNLESILGNIGGFVPQNTEYKNFNVNQT